MKNYSSKMKESFQVNNFFYIFIIVVIVIIFPSFMEKVSTTFISPAHIVRTWFYSSESSVAILWREKRELQDEIEEWERRWAEQSGNQASIARLINENTELRALLGGGEDSRILANVIGRPNNLPYDVYMIDKGREQGILHHAPVFFGFDTMVGFISHVKDNHSLVTLISTPRQKTTVFIVESGIFVQAEGYGAGWVRLRVPQGVLVNEGDTVVVASASGAVLGQIERIETTSTQPEQFAFVSLPQSVFSTRFLVVGTEAMKQLDFETVLKDVEILSRDILNVDVPADFEFSTTTATSTATTTEIDTIQESL